MPILEYYLNGSQGPLCEPFQPRRFTLSALTLPDPIAAYFAADTQGPDIASLEITV